MSLREKAAGTRIGETPYGRGSGQSGWGLQLEASLQAIAHAGLQPGDIDGVITYATSPVVAEDFITNFGLADLRFSAVTPLGGASCVAGLQCAAAAIAAGICRHVLLPIGRNGYSEGRVSTRVQ